jgi:hypothetical protein
MAKQALAAVANQALVTMANQALVPPEPTKKRVFHADLGYFAPPERLLPHRTIKLNMALKHCG